MNINEIINNIVNNVNKDWPTLYKIRYAYIELGKYLQKNTDFFFSVDKKLGSNNLSYEEIEAIYNDEVVLSTNVICKSASILLKSILDRLGIKSKLVKSINNFINYKEDDKELLINHWMLAVTDGENEYFCSLTSDLPYIQMGMETKHFAVNMPYIKELNDGSKIQVYEGEEIKHTVIDYDYMKQIDIEIGYVKDYYKYDESSQATKEWNLQYSNSSLHMLRDAIRGNRLFYELEIEKSDFYNKLINFKGYSGEEISFYDAKLSSLTENDWNVWIKNVCGEVLKKISVILGYEIYPIPSLESKYWNYESWLLSLSFIIENEIYKLFELEKDEINELGIEVDKFKYSKWSKKLKQKLDMNSIYEHENIILILDKMNALVNCVKSRGKSSNFTSLIQSLCYHFINPNNLYENNLYEDGTISSYYIANKFEEMFKKIFECNSSSSDFNNMSYSEQTVILKDVITVMFPELNVENSKSIPEYDERFSPVLNRIQMHPIKSKIDGEYSIIFSVMGDYLDDDFYFLYDLKNNTFGECNIFDVFNDYIFVSNRMKNKLGVEDLEKIEGQGIRK